MSNGAEEGRPTAESQEARPKEAKRQARFATARFEKWFLPRLASRLPKWVLPDHLTGLGVVAATAIGVFYGLSNRNENWLWAVNAALVVHWLGDSLDGTLARVRRIERPRYGFYLDHLTDAYSTCVIGIGLGLSPYLLLSVGLAIVMAYLVLSINVYLETHVFGRFEYGYGLVGPTEARLLLIGLNTLALTIGPIPFSFFGRGVTIYDVFGTAGALMMIGLLLIRARRNLKHLARQEPANTRREGSAA